MMRHETTRPDADSSKSIVSLPLNLQWGEQEKIRKQETGIGNEKKDSDNTRRKVVNYSPLGISNKKLNDKHAAGLKQFIEAFCSKFFSSRLSQKYNDYLLVLTKFYSDSHSVNVCFRKENWDSYCWYNDKMIKFFSEDYARNLWEIWNYIVKWDCFGG